MDFGCGMCGCVCQAPCIMIVLSREKKVDEIKTVSLERWCNS